MHNSCIHTNAEFNRVYSVGCSFYFSIRYCVEDTFFIICGVKSFCVPFLLHHHAGAMQDG